MSENMSTDQEDPHHCRCFKILATYTDRLKNGLQSISFTDTSLQLPQNQLFGLIKKIENQKQIHVKLLTTYEIEAEIEPSHEVPFAHLNSEHSYSAHKQLQNILHQLGIPYIKKWSIPLSCIRPIIKEPFKPTHVKVIVGVVFAVALVSVLAYALAKSSKS